MHEEGVDRSGEDLDLTPASEPQETLESTSQLQLVEINTRPSSSASADSAVIPTLISAGECRFLILLEVKNIFYKITLN